MPVIHCVHKSNRWQQIHVRSLFSKVWVKVNITDSFTLFKMNSISFSWYHCDFITVGCCCCQSVLLVIVCDCLLNLNLQHKQKLENMQTFTLKVPCRMYVLQQNNLSGKPWKHSKDRHAETFLKTKKLREPPKGQIHIPFKQKHHYTAHTLNQLTGDKLA